MGRFLAFALVLLAACSQPKPKPPTDPTKSPDLCLRRDVYVYPGSCGDMRTVEGWACAICDTDQDCVTPEFVYCVNLNACDDARCSHQRGRR